MTFFKNLYQQTKLLKQSNIEIRVIKGIYLQTVKYIMKFFAIFDNAFLAFYVFLILCFYFTMEYVETVLEKSVNF